MGSKLTIIIVMRMDECSIQTHDMAGADER